VLTGINACGDLASTTILRRLAASGVVEAGTTCDPPQFRGVAGSPRLKLWEEVTISCFQGENLINFF